jgi:DNA (cytosine-5)-methyltransferase 1
VDNTKKLPTVISFCSGYGGLERGLDLAGVKHRVIAYVEIEAFAIANLVSKMESGQLVPAPIFTDLKTFPAHLFRDCVDIITGGYPCQPFSAAGKRLGTEDPRHLWPYILDHIKAIRPVRCFFENVEGHISLGLREVIGDLESAGYNSTWGIFSAAEVGAPHQRKRVYILGSDPNCRDGSAQQERKYKRPKELDGCGDWGLAASGSADMANADRARQQTQRRESGAERETRLTGESGELANTSSQRFGGESQGQLQQPGRGEVVSPSENVADPKSQRGREIQSHGGGGAERGGEREGGGSIHSGEGHACRDFPDTGIAGLPQRDRQGASTKGQPYAESQCGGGLPPDLANTGSKGLQGQERCWTAGEEGESFGHFTKRGGELSNPNGRGQEQSWPPEPGLGRVVDGCADRVDRIRLLGNGVVPQTAAKAWTTLTSRGKK